MLLYELVGRIAIVWVKVHFKIVGNNKVDFLDQVWNQKY